MFLKLQNASSYIQMITKPFIFSFSIPHGEVTSPTDASPEGTTYSVSCDQGYTASSQSGSLECNEQSDWTNKPTCDRKCHVISIFNQSKCFLNINLCGGLSILVLMAYIIISCAYIAQINC